MVIRHRGDYSCEMRHDGAVPLLRALARTRHARAIGTAQRRGFEACTTSDSIMWLACAAAYGRVQTPCKAAGVPGKGAAGVSPIIKGETTEEREMRLAAKAKERLKKVGRRIQRSE
jgi:hypothetical protein